MNDSLRSLLAESIDYAGMFPPARLSLNEALKNHIRYLKQPEAWLIGRFVCPVNKLTSSNLEANRCFEELSGAVSNRMPYRLAAIATACDDSKQFPESLGRDVAIIVEFHKRHGNYARIDSLELRLPAGLNNSESLIDVLNGLRQQIDIARLRPLGIMIEVRPNDELPQLLALLGVLEPVRVKQLGLKIRTGGMPIGQLPSVEQLAFFIDACHVAGRRWKATAGLHQPFSRFDTADNVWRFGFVNVLAAAVSAWTGRITRGQISDILTETSCDAFALTDTAFAWRDLRMTVQEIRSGRRDSMMSFGSCSFDEPRDALRDAGFELGEVG